MILATMKFTIATGRLEDCWEKVIKIQGWKMTMKIKKLSYKIQA